MSLRRVLLLCTHNAARSQMAEGLVNHDLRDIWVAQSAGTDPAAKVHPLAIMAMAEVGIDISQQKPKHLRTLAPEAFDSVITVCDNAARTCPAWLGPATHVHHIGVADPSLAKGTDEDRMDAFRRARDDLRERVVAYLIGLE